MIPLHFCLVCMAQNIFEVTVEVCIYWILQKAASEGGGFLLAGTLAGLSSHSLRSYMTVKLRPNVTLGCLEMKYSAYHIKWDSMYI